MNKKRAEKSDIDEAEVAKINAIYEKIPKEEQLATAKTSMLSMWETVKNDAW